MSLPPYIWVSWVVSCIRYNFILCCLSGQVVYLLFEFEFYCFCIYGCLVRNQIRIECIIIIIPNLNLPFCCVDTCTFLHQFIICVGIFLWGDTFFSPFILIQFYLAYFYKVLVSKQTLFSSLETSLTIFFSLKHLKCLHEFFL